MGTVYQDLVYSDFPTTVSTMPRVQDVTAAMKPYVDLYNSYYSKGDFDSANQVLNDYPELLKMIINAKIFNELRDEIIATQRTFRGDTESYIFNVVKNKGDWSNVSKYIKYNVVYYTIGTTRLPYMAIADDIPIGALPTNIMYWYPLAIKGERGESGTGLTPRGYWNDSTQYYKDDMVAYNNVLWAALSDNVNYIPNESSTVWIKILAFSSEYLTYDNTESGLIANSMQGAIDELVSITDGLEYDAQSYALKTEIPTSLPANGGNSDTVDNKHAKDLFIKNEENISTKGITFDDGVGSWIPFKSCRTINGEKFSASLAVGTGKSLALELKNETTGTVLNRIDFRETGTEGGQINAEKLGGYTRSTSNTTGYHIAQFSTNDIVAGTTALSSGTMYVVYE